MNNIKEEKEEEENPFFFFLNPFKKSYPFVTIKVNPCPKPN